jgi:hypothetical protein
MRGCQPPEYRPVYHRAGVELATFDAHQPRRLFLITDFTGGTGGATQKTAVSRRNCAQADQSRRIVIFAQDH